MNTIFSTGQLSRLLGIPAYKIGYAHATGRLQEPAFWFLGKRCYTDADVRRVATHFGVTITDSMLAAQEAQ
jgi:hypothetical protein